MEVKMLWETVGGALAAGGVVLRLSLRHNRNENREMTIGGPASGIFTQGDFHGNATLTVGSPVPPATSTSGQPKSAATKIPLGAIAWAIVLIGLLIAGWGIYWDYFPGAH